MSEIEEFLKRAAAMRARQAQQTARPPVAPVRPTPQPARLVELAEVEDAEVVEAEEVSGDDVAELVNRHLDTGAFRERASHLGESVKSADEGFESHLHQTFEHRLGSLGASTSAAEDSVLDDDENQAKAANAKDSVKRAESSQEILTLLRSPQALRNAIIMAEIITPPRERW